MKNLSFFRKKGNFIEAAEASKDVKSKELIHKMICKLFKLRV